MMLSELCKDLNGQLHGVDLDVSMFSTDTREPQSGKMFVALRGHNFDGHDYVQESFQKGAIAALVDEQFDMSGVDTLNKTVLQVQDVLHAYGQIAAIHAASMPAKKIAITGSCGKTSVKEMLQAILSEKGKVLATQGNLNNEIGVPHTLLSICEEHEFAVVEMGANHAGEIAYLSSLLKADVVSVLNADRAHLEGFGSIDGVAHAKGEIFSGAKKGNACAVLSSDEKYFPLWKSLAEKNELKIVSCSLETKEADIHIKEIIPYVSGSHITVQLADNSIEMHIPFIGKHNVKNAAIAISIAYALGLSPELISKGISQAKSEKGRLQIHHLQNGITLIDDTYNANPLSVGAAIDVLAQFDQEKVLFLGDMAELGDAAKSMHQEMGVYARKKRIDKLFCCGSYANEVVKAFEGHSKAFEQQAMLLEFLPELLSQSKSSVYLVKGSRSSHMENIVNAILESEVAA